MRATFSELFAERKTRAYAIGVFLALLELLKRGRIAVEQSEEFAGKLAAAGVPVESHVYKDAPHSFFDRGFAQWKEACDDAWRRMLDFVQGHSA